MKAALYQAKKWLDATLAAATPRRATYAQAGEDVLVARLAPHASPDSHVYIDVGANHPTRISNTYLFYRRGFSGFLVEPNRRFGRLYRRFRPRDEHLLIGCSREPGLMQLYRHRQSVLNSLVEARAGGAVGSDWVPCLPLDALVPLVGRRRVFFLSVDCEGHDLAVLESGPALLRAVDIVSVERGNGEVERFLGGHGFRPAGATPHNLIFRQEAGPAPAGQARAGES